MKGALALLEAGKPVARYEQHVPLLHGPSWRLKLGWIQALGPMAGDMLRPVGRAKAGQEADWRAPHGLDADDPSEDLAHLGERFFDVPSMMETPKGEPDSILAERAEGQLVEVRHDRECAVC
jgi:hypothetical protein